MFLSSLFEIFRIRFSGSGDSFGSAASQRGVPADLVEARSGALRNSYGHSPVHCCARQPTAVFPEYKGRDSENRSYSHRARLKEYSPSPVSVRIPSLFRIAHGFGKVRLWLCAPGFRAGLLLYLNGGCGAV